MEEVTQKALSLLKRARWIANIAIILAFPAGFMLSMPYFYGNTSTSWLLAFLGGGIFLLVILLHFIAWTIRKEAKKLFVVIFHE